MKITLLYQVSHYIRVKKQRNIKSWDQKNYLVIRGFCYIRPLYNEVPLFMDKICLNRNEDKITNSEIYKQINNMSLNCVFHYMTKLKVNIHELNFVFQHPTIK